jgi:hypothetical protein
MISKLKFLFFGLMTCATNLQAQSELSISYVKGLSFAMGDFASGSSSNSKAGYAGIGTSTSYFFDYKFKNGNLGASVAVINHFNTFNSNSYAKSIEESLGVPGSDVSVYAGNYLRNGYLIGLNYLYPINEKITLTFKFLGGLTLCQIPQQEIYISGNAYGWAVQPAISASAFGTSSGISLKTRINERINFIADGCYFSSTPEFTDILMYGSSGSIQNYNSTLPMSTLQISGGITIKLTK